MATSGTTGVGDLLSRSGLHIKSTFGGTLKGWVFLVVSLQLKGTLKTNTSSKKAPIHSTRTALRDEAVALRARRQWPCRGRQHVHAVHGVEPRVSETSDPLHTVAKANPSEQEANVWEMSKCALEKRGLSRVGPRFGACLDS